MSLTPIVYVQTVASGAEPMPFLAAEFVASNLWSMALYIGNPTNIIVAQAFSLSFLDYSRWMLAPTAAAGLAATTVLYLTHRRALPARLALPEIPPASVLSDPWGAAFGAANLAVCLALLAAAPSLGFPLWAVTLVCAGASCAYGLCAYVLAPLWQRRLPRPPQGRRGGRSVAELLPRSGRGGATPSSSQFFDAGNSANGGGGSGGDASKEGAAGGSGAGSELLVWAGADMAAEASTGARAPLAVSTNGAAVDTAAAGDAAAWRVQQQPGLAPFELDHTPAAPDAAPLRPGDLDSAAAAAAAASAGAADEPPSGAAAAASSLRTQLAAKRPTFWGPFWSVPWDVVPLVLGFFILVEGLSANGWVDRLGAALGGSARSLAAGLWLLGAISVLMSNLIVNQPMTILLTRACMSPAFAAAASAAGAVAPAAVRHNLQAALFAVVVGSNTAACFTVIGSLAGIMWVAIIKQRGLRTTYVQFTRLMLPAGVASTAAALLVLWCEFAFSPY
ncbi:hypothetical protein MNEG_5352 [Monoraphidium neglectum]|uniref:Citrate transporter-like domain-containing protein n=1 Tax=Monoraphidium neglectum TaxID=145388 RepID=A0A0D2JUU9_9CHLO|nr:hypothetical protein MNEG_5352 [Monoraphidium neglectum]KIZ02603.1 hypothetical protein MNEG_5352 [Monoraphidium neglectum]|eukprot:XP_013901622.1 hypothetical protein MNEG_5352 [Monoraphidium neglectum]